MKKSTSSEIVKYLVNKELKKHGKKFEDVTGEQNEGWFQKYTWTQKEEHKFISTSIEWLRKKHKLSLKMAEKIMSEFILMWGLRVVD